MYNKRLLTSIVILLISFGSFGQKYEELARTPQMGWNSWNKFGCNIDEKLIRETADKMVELGLVEAGYIYLNLDDCWHGERDSLGFITEDRERFPSGMKALADYVHSKGMKFGIYSDAGRTTCAGKPGSFGHEYQDALTYASWGVDYLKYDWCATQDINPKGAYRLMRDALYNAGRPILFSMCEWGSNQPWLWAQDIGHSWRTTGDICAKFDEDTDYGNWKSLGVLSILDLQEGLRQYAGPGHWNDPDMLEVGNGMSVNEDRAHFTMWCMLAAPLLLGNDLTNMTEETHKIITNHDVIAINQDSLGVQGLKYKVENGLEFWFKPLCAGDWAFTVLNRTKEAVSYSIDWNHFCFTDGLSGRSTSFDETIYSYRDLWNEGVTGTTKGNTSITVPGYDVVTYRLTPKAKQITFDVVLEENNWLYSSPDKVEIKILAKNHDIKALSSKIALKVSTDKHAVLKNYSKSVKLKGGDSSIVTFTFPLTPGIYRLEASIPGGKVKKFNIGYDIEKIPSPADAQPDFKEFWDRAKKELAAVAPEYDMVCLSDRSTPTNRIFLVTMKSLGGETITGYYSEPRKPGKYPAVINFIGYNSDAWCPGGNPDFIEFVLFHRGQGLNKASNKYGDWIQYRLDDIEKYYYRGAYMDVVRAIDFVCSREKVDKGHIFAQGGSQGGALTLVACALDDRICAGMPDVPFLCDFPDYFGIVDWPASAVFNGQKSLGVSDAELYKNLSYFDVKNLAGWIKCPILMAFGLQDETCPPHTNFSAYNLITSPKSYKVYPLRGHDVWNETSWDSIRWDFIKNHLN